MNIKIIGIFILQCLGFTLTLHFKLYISTLYKNEKAIFIVHYGMGVYPLCIHGLYG